MGTPNAADGGSTEIPQLFDGDTSVIEMVYREAIKSRSMKYFSWVIQGMEKIFGPDHASTLNRVNDVGVFYSTYGNLQQATNMFQRVLHGQEKTLGRGHTLTLKTVFRLGHLYYEQGQLNEAKRMLWWAMQHTSIHGLGQDQHGEPRTVGGIKRHADPTAEGRHAKMRRLETVAAKPPSSSNIMDLPKELICHIAKFLDNRSFRMFRLLGKTIPGIIELDFLRRFFQDRRHLCTVHSLRVLSLISARLDLTKHLKRVELVLSGQCRFHPSRLSPEVEHKLVKCCEAAWANECAAMRTEGPRLLTEALRNLAKKENPPAIAISSSGYPQPYGFGNLCDGSFAFWNLFNPVQTSYSEIFGNHIQFHLPEALGPVLGAIHAARFPLTDFSVSGNEDVGNEDGMKFASFTPEMPELSIWSKLRRLHLFFGELYVDVDDRVKDSFLDVVKRLNSLQDFSFGFLPRLLEQETSAFVAVTTALASKELQRFSVVGMYIPVDQMIEFMKSHGSTLRYLGLKDICLSSRDGWDQLLEHMTGDHLHLDSAYINNIWAFDGLIATSIYRALSGGDMDSSFECCTNVKDQLRELQESGSWAEC